MIFRLTSILGRKIGLDSLSDLPVDMNNSILDWSAHLFTVRHTQYILMTSSATLYSMIMHGRGITSCKLFTKGALSCMEEFMILDGNRTAFEKLIEQNDANVFFTKIASRRILGSMNDLIFQAKIHLGHCQQSPHEASSLLNESPMSYLKYSSPKSRFQEVFGQDSQSRINQKTNGNVIPFGVGRPPKR